MVDYRRQLCLRLAAFLGTLAAWSATAQAECVHPGADSLNRLLGDTSFARPTDYDAANRREEVPSAPARRPCLPGMSCGPQTPAPLPPPPAPSNERPDANLLGFDSLAVLPSTRSASNRASQYSLLPADALDPPPRQV